MVNELMRLRALILAFQASDITLNQFCLRAGVVIEEIDAMYFSPDESRLSSIWADLEIMNATSLDDPSYRIANGAVQELTSEMLKQVETISRSLN